MREIRSAVLSAPQISPGAQVVSAQIIAGASKGIREYSGCSFGVRCLQLTTSAVALDALRHEAGDPGLENRHNVPDLMLDLAREPALSTAEESMMSVVFLCLKGDVDDANAQTRSGYLSQEAAEAESPT